MIGPDKDTNINGLHKMTLSADYAQDWRLFRRYMHETGDERDACEAKLVTRLENPDIAMQILNDLLLLYNNWPPSVEEIISTVFLEIIKNEKSTAQHIEILLNVFEDHFLVEVPFPTKSGYFHLFSRCLKWGVFEKSRVVSFIRDFAEYHWNYRVSLVWLFLWFAAEIYEEDRLLYQKLYTEYETTIRLPWVPRQFKYFKPTFDSFHKTHNWDEYHQELEQEPSGLWVKDCKDYAGERIEFSIFSRFWFLLGYPTRAQCISFLSSESLRVFPTKCFQALTDAFGHSLTFFAAGSGNQAVFDTLPDTDKFDAALHAVLFNQSLKVDGKNILDFKDRKDQEGRTLVHYAALANDIDLLSQCAKLEWDLCIQDIYLWTPLHLAVMNGNYAAAALLLEHGASVVTEAADKVTPIHLVAKTHRTDIFDLLAAAPGFDVNCQTEDQETPLHYAVEAHQIEMAKKLLATKNCDLELTRSSDHRTAQELAESLGYGREFENRSAAMCNVA